MICFIPSKARPQTNTYKLFEDVGIGVKHFVEPQDIGFYNVPNVVDIEKNDMGISYVRNFMLEYAKKNNHDWIIVCDDDISAFYEYVDGKNIKRDAAIWNDIHNRAKQLPFEIHGINNQQLIWTAKQKYAINKNSVEACVLMNVAKIDWDYDKDTKEDKDFVMKTIQNGHGVVKYLTLGFATPPVGSNKGGLHEKYAVNRDYKWAVKMAKKWHPFAKVYKTPKKIDVRINYKEFAKSLNKVVR